MMKLFHAPGACSLAVHIAAREAGIALELVKVDLATHRLVEGGGDYRDINPRGYVPALRFDDGSLHTEVAALLQHLADGAPASGLLPAAGSGERLAVLEWVAFVASELHKTFSPWLWHKETADSTRQACRDKLALRFAEMNEWLAARAWLAADRFTIADAYAFTIVGWSRFLGIGLKAYPHLVAYLERVAARPAVHAALLAEGLVTS